MTAGEARFGSAAEEAAHYKAQVRSMQDALQEAENGLQEFMESSKELEAELEADIAQSTARADELQAENESLRLDVDEWRGKYQQSLSENNATLGELHRELSKLRESHDAYKTKLRDMELDNDELENAERMINSSLTDMEGRYNSAMEKTALLESELEDKTRLEEENQRLKDELRDLREELAIVQSAPRPDDDLQLSDLVVKAPKPTKNTLERLREHMQQLQVRLHTAQTPVGRPNEKSALPRPRSSLSHSQSGSPWRSQTPVGGRATPARPETPTSARTDRRKSNSFIPVPTNGLSRSASRRPTSRLGAVSPTHVPYEFMEHDPSLSPGTRRASVARRRSISQVPAPNTPRRAASPSKLRASPTKPVVPWR